MISLYKKTVTVSSETTTYIIEPNRLHFVTTTSGTLLCCRACIIVFVYHCYFSVVSTLLALIKKKAMADEMLA